MKNKTQLKLPRKPQKIKIVNIHLVLSSKEKLQKKEIATSEEQ